MTSFFSFPVKYNILGCWIRISLLTQKPVQLVFSVATCKTDFSGFMLGSVCF